MIEWSAVYVCAEVRCVECLCGCAVCRVCVRWAVSSVCFPARVVFDVSVSSLDGKRKMEQWSMYLSLSPQLSSSPKHKHKPAAAKSLCLCLVSIIAALCVCLFSVEYALSNLSSLNSTCLIGVGCPSLHMLRH